MEYNIVPTDANIDIHNHTRGSDGRQRSMRMLLRAAKTRKNIVSITDHNSVDGYKNLEDDLYSIVEVVKEDESYDPSHIIDVLETVKLLTGTELITSYQGVIVEVLGYGIDIDIMREEIRRLQATVTKKPYEVLYSEFKKLIKEKNLVFDESVLDAAYQKIKLEGKGGVVGPFYQELASHPENDRFLEYEENGAIKRADNLKLYINKHLYNKDSELFVDMTDSRPTFQDTIDAIHRAGGKAFLAHPGRYMDKFNVINYLDEMIDCNLDGIEVFYSNHSYEFSKTLFEKVRQHAILASGGSDDHHSDVEGIQYNTGRVSVPQVAQTEWIMNSVQDGGYLKQNNILRKYIDELKAIRSRRISRKEEEGR